MSFIDDGSGKGYKAKVNNRQQLTTESVSISEQHYRSLVDEAAFQVSQEISISNSEQSVLLIENTDADNDIVITYIRVMSIGAAASNASAYFEIKVGGNYSSGGSDLTAVNLNVNSSN